MLECASTILTILECASALGCVSCICLQGNDCQGAAAVAAAALCQRTRFPPPSTHTLTPCVSTCVLLPACPFPSLPLVPPPPGPCLLKPHSASPT